MAKFQSPNYNINCVVDPVLRRLLNKKAKAKYKVDLEVEYINPLLAAGPEDANSLAIEVKYCIKEIESLMRDFNLVHRERIKRYREAP